MVVVGFFSQCAIHVVGNLYFLKVHYFCIKIKYLHYFVFLFGWYYIIL